MWSILSQFALFVAVPFILHAETLPAPSGHTTVTYLWKPWVLACLSAAYFVATALALYALPTRVQPGDIERPPVTACLLCAPSRGRLARVRVAWGTTGGAVALSAWVFFLIQGGGAPVYNWAALACVVVFDLAVLVVAANLSLVGSPVLIRLLYTTVACTFGFFSTYHTAILLDI